MSNIKKLMMSAAGGGEALNVEDVFSTYLYTGDYNTGTLNQHIKNNVPLSNFGTGGTSVNFNGGAYLTRSDFTGNTTGKTLTFSAWVLFNDFENNFIFSSDPNGGGSGINVGYFSGKLRFFAYNNLGSPISEWQVDDTNTPFHQWFHLCFSVNTASGVGATKVYINDVAATTESVTSSNQDINFTRTVQRIGARATDYKLTGNLAHVFMDYTYRDLDIESNRRLFIDANGGSTDPSTLSALNPIMYCPLTDDYTMGKNLGTGGDFTSSGGPAFSTLGTEATADTSDGGMVWIKNRSQTDYHMLFDTERGAPNSVSSNTSDSEVTYNPDTLTQFLADGFFLGDDVAVNTSNESYASWTFRKAPKFFDVVTYTGNGTARTISHNLGSVPGCVIIKNRTTSNRDWAVYHRGANASSPEDYPLTLNNTAIANNNDWFNDTAPTSSVFSVKTDSRVNTNGNEYVAYLFAHNDGDGEFGPDGDADIIKCGKVTTIIGDVDVDLGFEPQFILFKCATNTDNWNMVDNVRGWANSRYGTNKLSANSSNAEEGSVDFVTLTPTGFKTVFVEDGLGSSQDYIYIAIRRGTKVPESATEVFAVKRHAGADGPQPAGITSDMVITTHPTTASTERFNFNRLTNGKVLYTSQTFAEGNYSPYFNFNTNDGVNTAGMWGNTTLPIYYHFKRAPGFFDVVAYNGNSLAGHAVSHNLGVAPEMMWIKRRNNSTLWCVYHHGIDVDGDGSPETDVMFLNATSQASDNNTMWNDTAPTATHFTLGNYTGVNNGSGTYIAYLFASLDGVSKVGSYTGNGSSMGDSQTIDCGFTSGARFVLIKRTSGTGEWFVFDTERGIVAGSDAYITLHSNASQVSGGDYIDPHNSGFTVVQHPATETNTSGETYIFYAIA